MSAEVDRLDVICTEIGVFWAGIGAECEKSDVIEADSEVVDDDSG